MYFLLHSGMTRSDAFHDVQELIHNNQHHGKKSDGLLLE